jgi:predicted small lipoprotein YifL
MRALLALVCAGLLLTACGRKNPPEIPEGEDWTPPYEIEYGGGYDVDDEETVRVETPPPAYFPGTEGGASEGAGVLTYPQPSQ